MNYKLEKFWNRNSLAVNVVNLIMNYKLEKFWNMEDIKLMKTNIENEL